MGWAKNHFLHLRDLKAAVACLSLSFMAMGCFGGLDGQNLVSRGEGSVYAFDGCASATALDTSRISVAFSFPADATALRINRNGIKIAEFKSADVSSYED